MLLTDSMQKLLAAPTESLRQMLSVSCQLKMTKQPEYQEVKNGVIPFATQWSVISKGSASDGMQR